MPVKKFSLTKRIIFAVVACQLLLTAGLIVVSVVSARKELREAFDAGLESRALSTLALVRYTDTNPPTLVFDMTYLPRPSSNRHEDFFEIRGADDRLIARSVGWGGVSSISQRVRGAFGNFNVAGTPYRSIMLTNMIVPDHGNGAAKAGDASAKVSVFYAASMNGINLQLGTVALSVGGMSLLLLSLASGLAAWSVQRGLIPLRDLAEQAGAISVQNWDFRAPLDATATSELAPLATAIETVLARLKTAFRQQREFTSDAAHELKTSVAIVKSTLQSMLQRPRSTEEYREGMEGMLEDCARLEDLLDRMLRLARLDQLAETGAPRKLATTELTSTCEIALSRMRAVADARNIALEFESPGAVHMQADPEDLELIWLNLVENAVRYSPSGSKVILRVHRNGSAMAEVSVCDSGPGIPPEELPHIFERFRRGDPSRSRSTGGFGLGLAICKAIVDAYHGSIEAINLPGCGTEFRVHLPADSD